MDNASSQDTPEEEPPASPWSVFEAAYRDVLSLDRLQRYRKDRDRAAWTPMIGRYMYNVEVARALMPVLHWAEVALRNRLHRVIGAAYPIGGARSFIQVPCWLDADPPVLLPNERARVEQAKRKLKAHGGSPGQPGKKARPLTEGRLVAELSLGFWTHLLDGAYENWRTPHRLWPALLEPVFPHCPAAQRTRKNVHGRYVAIKDIRNRAFHHERISHQVTVALYDRFVETVEWIDPLVAGALAERDRPAFVALLQAGPAPFVEWARRRAA
jgi:hypothetical protein